MNKSSNVGLLIAILLLGMGIGYFLTPLYQSENVMVEKSHDLGPADRFVDLRYLDGMIAHHLSAIYMLEQALEQSHTEEIRDLAETVIAADRKGIEQLYAYKKTWYNNEVKVSDFEKINLGTNDDKFDLRLLNALLIHHDEAIERSREISTKTTRNEVLNIADETTQVLSANAELLKQWRKEWYGI